MIEVIYYRKYHLLTVTGHADSAEHGHDLICASASMLTYTLAANVANMAKAGEVRQPILQTEEGNARIGCNPVANLKHVVTLVFDTVLTGFALLAHDYPDFVKYEIRP